jgi:hypothetical protein
MQQGTMIMARNGRYLARTGRDHELAQRRRIPHGNVASAQAEYLRRRPLPGRLELVLTVVKATYCRASRPPSQPSVLPLRSSRHGRLPDL